jgi:hypothetical protein
MWFLLKTEHLLRVWQELDEPHFSHSCLTESGESVIYLVKGVDIGSIGPREVVEVQFNFDKVWGRFFELTNILAFFKAWGSFYKCYFYNLCAWGVGGENAPCSRSCTMPVSVRRAQKSASRESYVHGVLNKVYLQNLFTYECNFARWI